MSITTNNTTTATTSTMSAECAKWAKFTSASGAFTASEVRKGFAVFLEEKKEKIVAKLSSDLLPGYPALKSEYVRCSLVTDTFNVFDEKDGLVDLIDHIESCLNESLSDFIVDSLDTLSEEGLFFENLNLVSSNGKFETHDGATTLRREYSNLIVILLKDFAKSNAGSVAAWDRETSFILEDLVLALVAFTFPS